MADTDSKLKYTNKHYLPSLYNTDKTGKQRVWKVWSEGNVLYKCQGVVDGKMIDYEKTISGKNIGRSNETSPEKQAEIEADRAWVSQITKGYKPRDDDEVGNEMLSTLQTEIEKVGGHGINAASSIGSNPKKAVKNKSNKSVGVIQTKITPMKAGVWELEDDSDVSSIPQKIKSKFDWERGVYLQPKLDGIRCVARLQETSSTEFADARDEFADSHESFADAQCVMTTNNGKEFPWFEEMRKEIIEFLNGKDYLDGLDGEIYSHEINSEDGSQVTFENRFSVIQSVCGIARSTPHPLENQLKLCVFDLVDLSGTLSQQQRFDKLKGLFSGYTGKYVKLVKTLKVHNINSVGTYHDEFAGQGYEGVMVRSADLTYIQKRTLYMRKYKNFNDIEVRVIGAQKDEGLGDATFVWKCQVLDEDTSVSSSSKKVFKAKPRGTEADKIIWWKNRDDYIGKLLTVKFQNYSADGIPRFPIGIGFREDQ